MRRPISKTGRIMINIKFISKAKPHKVLSISYSSTSVKNALKVARELQPTRKQTSTNQ